jgi:hypothetical protein
MVQDPILQRARIFGKMDRRKKTERKDVENENKTRNTAKGGDKRGGRVDKKRKREAG